MKRGATVSQSLWDALRSELASRAALALEFLRSDSDILYACFSVNPFNKGGDLRALDKQAAVSALVPFVSAMQGEFRVETHGSVPNIEISSDSLGRPRLLIDGSEGPAVSFAYVRDTMWVAVSRNESNIGIGIDAEESASFRGKYPFHRVFHKEELECGGEKEDVAALIWSAKEAVVKALGCGFHLVDPLHVRVQPCHGDHGGLLREASLANDAREKLRVQIQDPIPVRSLRYKGMWVSVASLC